MCIFYFYFLLEFSRHAMSYNFIGLSRFKTEFMNIKFHIKAVVLKKKRKRKKTIHNCNVRVRTCLFIL